jgi:hypothetical protein
MTARSDLRPVLHSACDSTAQHTPFQVKGRGQSAVQLLRKQRLRTRSELERAANEETCGIIPRDKFSS